MKSILKSFFIIVIKEYKRSQKIFLPLLIAGLILAYELFVFFSIDMEGNIALKVGLYFSIILSILYLIIIIYIIPTYIFFPSLKTFSTIKYSLLIGIAHPFHTLALIALYFIVGFISFFVPFLVVVFSFSVITSLNQWVLLKKYHELSINYKPLDIRDYR